MHLSSGLRQFDVQRNAFGRGHLCDDFAGVALIEKGKAHAARSGPDSECVGQRQDLGGKPALGAAYSLALTPLLRPDRAGGL
jgi:hypothetical protein